MAEPRAAAATPEPRTAAAEPSGLDFSLTHAAGGAGLLRLAAQRLFGWLRLEDLELVVAGIGSPDAAPGDPLAVPPERLQRRRTRAAAAVLRMEPADLAGFLTRRAPALAALGLDELAIDCDDDGLVLAGRAREDGHAAEVSARLHPIASGGRLRLVIGATRTFGFLPTPTPLFAHRLLAALTADPTLGAHLRGLGDVALDPLNAALWRLLPVAGWRMPDQRHLRLARVEASGAGLTIEYDDQRGGAPAVAGKPASAELVSAALLAELERTRRGDDLLVAGNYAGALRAYRADLSHGGPGQRLLIERMLALTSARAELFLDGGELARQVLGRTPDAPAAHAALAAIALAQGDLDAATSRFRSLSDAAERNGERGTAVRAALAGARLAQRAAPREATALYERALALDPGQGEAALALADRYAVEHRHGELARLLEARLAGTADPIDRAHDHLRLGRLLAGPLGDAAAGRAAIERSIALDPSQPAAYEALAQVAAALGDRRAADRALGHAALLHAERGDRAGESRARNAAGELTLDAGDAGGAIARFQAALEVDLDDLTARAGLATALAAAGRPAAAAAAWRDVLAIAPPDQRERALGELGRALAQAGERDEARAALAEAAAASDDVVAGDALAALAALDRDAGALGSAADRLAEAIQRLAAAVHHAVAAGAPSRAVADRAATLGLERAALCLALERGDEAAGERDRAWALAASPGLRATIAATQLEAAERRDDRAAIGEWLSQWLALGAAGDVRAALLGRRARLALEAGDPAAALADADAALAVAESRDLRAAGLAVRGEALGAAEHPAGQAAALIGAAELSGDPVARVRLTIAAAEAWLAADELESALATAQAALARLAETVDAAVPPGARAAIEHAALACGAEAAWRARDWPEVEAMCRALLDGAGAASGATGPAAAALAAHRLGSALESRGEIDGAIAAHEEAARSPAVEVASGSLRRLIALHEQRGDLARAADAAERLATGPLAEAALGARADAWFRAAELHRRAGDVGGTERACLAAVELIPEHLPALDALERIARDSGDDERIAVVLGKKIAATHGHPGRQKALLARLATHYGEVLGRHDVARETWARALELDPYFRPALRFRARDRAARGATGEALATQLALARELPGDGDLAEAEEALVAERLAAARTAIGLGRATRSAEAVRLVSLALEPLLPLASDPGRLLVELEDAARAAGDSYQVSDVLGRRAARASRDKAIELERRRIDVLVHGAGDQDAALAVAEAAVARHPGAAVLLEWRDALLLGTGLPAHDLSLQHSGPIEPLAITGSRPVEADPELTELRAQADAALAADRAPAAATALEAIVVRMGALGQGGRPPVAEVLLELADLYFDRLGDVERGRTAMRRAADAFGRGARRDGTLRLLASEATAAGAHAEAAAALEAIDGGGPPGERAAGGGGAAAARPMPRTTMPGRAPISRLTAADRVTLAKAHQRLGQERRALEVLEAGRAAGALTDEGALLLFSLLRERQRGLELAGVLERGAAQAGAEIAPTRLRQALELYRDTLGDEAGAARIKARLAALGEADDRPPAAAELVRAADAAAASGDAALATDLLHRALVARFAQRAATGPGPGELLDRLRETAERAGRPEPLIAGLEAVAAAEGGPGAAGLLAEAGALAHGIGDRPRAAELLTRALALAPERAELAAQVDDVLRQAGTPIARLAAWEHHAAAVEGPARARALLVLARLHRDELGDPDRARAVFAEALALSPELADQLAGELAALERDGAALPGADVDLAFERLAAPADDPSDPAAAAGLRASTDLEAEFLTAKSLEQRGHIDAAIAQFESTWLAAPTDRRALEALERLYRVTGDADALSETLGRLVVLTSDRATRAALWHRRAKLYRDILGREPEAYRCLKEAFANDPDSPDIAHALRSQTMARGEWGLAAELIYRELAATSDPIELAALYLELALIYDEKLADPRQATINYEQALLLDPTIPAVPRPLARLYAAAGRPKDAARLYERAAGFAAGEVERGRLLRLAAQAADHAGLPDEVRRLHELAAQVADDGTLPTAPMAEIEPAARLESLESRLRLTADKDEASDLRRQVLALAIEIGDRAAVERHASALVASHREDVSAYSSLTADASSRGNWSAMAALLAARVGGAEHPAERAALRFELGRIRVRELGDQDAAVEAFELCLIDQPSHVGALEALADLSYVRRDWLRARELYERLPADASLPADVIAYRRGEIAEVLGNDEEAAVAFARAVELYPHSRQALIALSRTALRIGDHGRALVASRALLELLPPDDVRALRAARLQLAELSQRVGDLAGAVTHFEQVLSEEPRSITALTALISLHGERGDHAAATRVLRALIALTPAPSQRADLLYRLGELYRRGLEDHDQAADSYLKAIDLDPDHVPTLRRLIDVYWRQADDKSLMEVAHDLHDRGALLETTSSTATLAHVMVVAALLGHFDLAMAVAGYLGPAAELALGAAAGDVMCRVEHPRVRDVVAAMIDLASRTGLDRRNLTAGLSIRAQEDAQVKPLLTAFKKA